MQKSRIILNFYIVVLKMYIPGKIILDCKSKVSIKKFAVMCFRFCRFKQ